MISPRQHRVFNFIKGYIASNGAPPKFSQIGKEFGYSSPATVHRIVSILVHEGLLVRHPRTRKIQMPGENEPEAEPKIRCPKCDEDKPRSEFGICRARESGRNLYCRPCIRETVYAGRARVKQMKVERQAARQKLIIQRKPFLMASLTPTQKVCKAIMGGCRTRYQIKYETRLPLGEVCDVLAVLVDDQLIGVARVEGEAHFYPRVNGVFVSRAA